MKKFGIIFFALGILISSSSITANLSSNDNPLITEQSSKETFMSQYGDYIIGGSLIALVASVLLIIRWEQNKILQEQRIQGQKLNDNDIIQFEQENLKHYKSNFEQDCRCASIVDIESFIMYIKQKNCFPYFIPYRSKVAYAYQQCLQSLKRINERLDPQFVSYNVERNLDGLIQLKKEYEEFIEKLDNLREIAHKCIKLSTVEYILLNHLIYCARIANNSLNHYIFSYLVDDLI